jgi:hypothetical protein
MPSAIPLAGTRRDVQCQYGSDVQHEGAATFAMRMDREVPDDLGALSPPIDAYVSSSRPAGHIRGT